ncbi:cytochrome c oxidase subunit II [Blastococcus saxobsidens]|uniref:cytochrome-c oxidase n=1 Tax=Blastococcus saxobsidens (strain DD2) TaxID=1146883 RepID=H6RSR3_BLASD|nr:cytochrome c oxidase subunit II [Blastococcus saxobsidens]CCG03016.1 cytochrome c oxidase subunit 2 [Blastococcus saxobsidens DD2]
MARGSRLARLAALGLLGVLTLTGCDITDREFWVENFVRFGWPEGITDEAESMRTLWIWSSYAALLIGGVVWALIAYTVIAHRKKSDELPRQTAYNLPLEIVYTIIPFAIIAGLFFFTVVTQNEVLDRDEEPDTTIAVNAFKWNWQFVYPETAGPDGEPVDTVGTSTEIPILVVPTDQTVQFELASADVIHSFWVPDFLFKLDVIPGNENGRDNVFQVTVREEGAYVGRCAELCGTYHAYMNFEVRAVPGDVYDAYLEAREEGLSTYEALEEIGEEGVASTTTPLDLIQTKVVEQLQPAGD